MYHKILVVLKWIFSYLIILTGNPNQKLQILKQTSAPNKGLAKMEHKLAHYPSLA